MSERRATGMLARSVSELLESFSMALGSIAAHKLRSALTLLGVIVGVFSIIVVMTAMRALQANIESELSGLGANTFTISRWPAMHFTGPEGWEKYRRRQAITYDLMLDLNESAKLPLTVSAEERFRYGEAASDDEQTNPDVSLTGMTVEAFRAKNLTIAEGRALLPVDEDGARLVCVLGDAVKRKLFPFGGALGSEVRFDGIVYRVVGVLERKGGMGGEGQDNFVAIPLTTGFNLYGGRTQRTIGIFVQARGRAAYDDTVEETRGILRKLRKVAPGEEDDFEIISNDSLIEQFRELTFAVRMGVALVSSIALVAAGVGIMNIMLVSVTERTREIGIRRAIGAKKRNVLTQFILEAVVLCELGGLIGVALGVAGGNLGAVYLKTPPVIPFDWVVIGLVICSLVGIVFGTYPAIKAANLDPVDSLRYE